jgi:DNA-binding YbaB/EbfC family protein
MPDFMKMLEQAQQMQSRLKQVQDDLEKTTVASSSGGGMVTVEADGKGQISRVKIDPSVVNPADVAMLEDLILVAARDVQKKAEDVAKVKMADVTGGLNLPFKLPF